MGGVGRGNRQGSKGCLPPMPPHLYIGVKGAGGLPSKALGLLAKGGGRKPLLSFPTDRYPPFLGILILSLWDMIPFLLREDLGAPRPGLWGLSPLPTFMWVPHAGGPHSRTFPVQYRKNSNFFRNPDNNFPYMNLYLRTIPELLVMSGISSGTPNNLRSF